MMWIDLLLEIIIKKTVAAYGLQRFSVCKIANWTYSHAFVSSATDVP